MIEILVGALIMLVGIVIGTALGLVLNENSTKERD